MLQRNDLKIASGCREDINLTHNRLQRDNLKPFHACLQSANRVNLCDQDAGACTPHGKCTSFTHIAVSANQSSFASNHDVGGAHDAIWQRVPAAVHIVKLRFCHAIVNVDCWKEQLALCCHFFKSVHTSSCFLELSSFAQCTTNIQAKSLPSTQRLLQFQPLQ